MREKKTIMYGDCAVEVTVILPDESQHPQWFCTKCRRIWGHNDQHMASWCCCTHRICDCGKEYEKSWTCCEDCRDKKDRDRWYAKPEQHWDGEFPLALADCDRYFFDDSCLLDYLREMEGTYQELVDTIRLTSCTKQKPRTFEVNEWVCDELPEDSDGVDDADSIDERINAILDEIKVISYMADNVRLNVKQVFDRIGFLDGDSLED